MMSVNFCYLRVELALFQFQYPVPAELNIRAPGCLKNLGLECVRHLLVVGGVLLSDN